MGLAIVVVGASWGGLNAVSALVGGLPADFAAPVVVVQHRSKDSDSLLSSLLQDHTPLRVLEVDDKEPIAPGYVYIAPADYHLLIDDVGDGAYFSLSVDAPVRYSRPSIDVTFSSAADSFGAGAAGVVLTGANDDGSRGLRLIVDRGGRGIVQRPDSAEVATMPRAALRLVPEAAVLDLAEIAPHLARMARRAPEERRARLRTLSTRYAGDGP